MKNTSVLSFILFLFLISSCTPEEKLLTIDENSEKQNAFLLVNTEDGRKSFDLSDPSEELLSILRSKVINTDNTSQSVASCSPPCEAIFERVLTGDIVGLCGVQEDCSFSIEMNFCYQNVSNGTTEIFFELDSFSTQGCEGADEDCIKTIAIERITSSIMNSIYELIPTLPAPIACGGPTINWYSTYSEESCSSNCENVDCGTACCQYYTSWCLDDDNDLLLGQFTGSNQISDCSGNNNLPEGCKCFQTSCENQYDF